MFELGTITLGNILTLVGFLVGGMGFAYTIRTDVRTTSVRLSAVEEELRELRSVVVQIARQEERMNAIDQRLILTGQRLDDCAKKIDKAIERAP